MREDPSEIRKRIVESLTSPLVKALDGKGITTEYLAEKLKEELEAKEIKIFQYQGEVVESPELIAWEIRQKARMDAQKLRGDYPAEKKSVAINDFTGLERDLSDEEREKIKRIEAILEE